MKSKYFKITELVCPHIHKKWGDAAWMFVDERLIETLDVLKEKIFAGRSIIINNWNVKQGGYSQRGFRCNLCDIVKEKTKSGTLYLSAHTTGKAVDMSVEGLTASQARAEITRSQVLLPHNIRLESDKLAPTWVHLDVYDADKKVVMIE